MEVFKPIGVGSPGVLYLHEFGRLIYKVFKRYPCLVGSSLKHKNPRDIDVRLLVEGIRESILFPDIDSLFDVYQPGTPWAVVCMAFSSLGKEITGLPIDFQIQLPGLWEKYKDEPRLEIGKDPGTVTNVETFTPEDSNS